MKYIVSHWEVDVDEKLYDSGNPMVTDTYRFYNEKDAIEYAKERCNEGKQVAVKIVQFIENW